MTTAFKNCNHINLLAINFVMHSGCPFESAFNSVVTTLQSESQHFLILKKAYAGPFPTCGWNAYENVDSCAQIVCCSYCTLNLVCAGKTLQL